MWHGYHARWKGQNYRAAVYPQPEQLLVRLYRSTPADGFDEIQSGRYVRVVSVDECDEIRFVTVECEWRGAPFHLHDERDDDLLLEYIGGEAPVARRLDLERVEFGVYRGWVPRAQITALQEISVRVDL